MSDPRSIDNFIEDCFRMLNIEGLNVHSRRGWLYKSLLDYTAVLEATGAAGTKLFWSRRWHQSNNVGRRSTRREHAYPLGLITCELAPEAGPWKAVNIDDLSRRFHALIVCYITKEEDDALNATVIDGLSLKTRMPGGSDCRFSRYHLSRTKIVPTAIPPSDWRRTRGGRRHVYPVSDAQLCDGCATCECG